ncbi:MAG: FAD-binding oxidoreductase [Rhodanobacteraceae bacterium]
MNRRDALTRALLIPLLPFLLRLRGAAWAGKTVARFTHRVRPGDPAWPSAAEWERLNTAVGGRLSKLKSPLDVCRADAGSAACSDFFKQLRNPYFIRDNAALTQTSGYLDAWTSRPSAYAVAAKNTADVVAAVDFAREHQLRLVVKGAGHSYQGTSDAPDSLLVWTRYMDDVRLHDAFVAQDCAGKQSPQSAVTVGPGCIWMHTYNAVTTQGGRYVQGGGCATVGVAGLIQSGGFGSFSKRYGIAAAGLIEAEIVTADGEVRIANDCTNPDLFWAIKGGGGSSVGVLTRLTLRTRELPEFFGAVLGKIKANSDDAYRRLIERFVAFYQDALFNPHWGETVSLSDRTLDIKLVFQGLMKSQAQAIWKPFFDFVSGAPHDYTMAAAPIILAIPARQFWNPEVLKKLPGLIVADDRPGASADNILWAGDQSQSGQFIHGYGSAWLPVSLLQQDQQPQLVDALCAASAKWGFSLHFNKGLAGAPAEEIAAGRDTAIHPAMLDAFALAITGGEEPATVPGIPGHEPDLDAARRASAAIGKTMATLRKLVPDAGSYVSESDYFQKDWQRAFWGTNYPRLAAIKKRYDPDGLFFVHHGVGSEEWSADGFTRLR